MIPIGSYEELDEIINDFETEIIEPSKTYKLRLENNTITGMCDGLEAIKQAVFKILGTELYEDIIYNWNYGVETRDLIDEDTPYVLSEIKDRIKSALLRDDRIEDVTDFEISMDKGKISVVFIVITTEGNFQATKGVDI